MFASGLGIVGRDAELARIGGRTASRDELTGAERRVAELVAQVMSNREAAAALFVTVKTVEAALSRVYHKLGVRSRAELARRFADSSERGIRSRPRT
jgi:DNA-binding CsgD family transcriptional regulator